MSVKVGHAVHYTAFGTPGGEFASKCRAAIVTDTPETDTTGRVSLAVLQPSGIYFNPSVPLDERDVPAGGTWHLPCE